MFDTFKELIKEIKENKYSSVIRGILFSIVPFLLFCLMESYEHNPFSEVRFKAIFFNIFLFELIAWILYALIGRARIALWIETVVAMVFGLTNHYVMEFRSTPFVPWDIFSVKTASSVASNYDFTPSSRVVVVSILFLAVLVLAGFMNFKMKMKFYFRLIPTAIILVALCLFVNVLQDEDFQTDNYLYPFLFTPAYMTKVNGMAVTFAMDLAYISVDKPSGYSVSKAQETLESYSTASEEETSDDQDYPNIIVIMDEAFSDLSVLGGFSASEDYMPFIHSLQDGADNTVSGYLNVSVCGGNTANSEFEFLTGDTMAFLPSGSIPYQQYIKSDTPSLASHLESLGYTTYAQHPYYADGWCRNTVYPMLGFDNLSFIDDYYNYSIIRKYISDESSFDKIISTYQNKEEGSPAFIFNVTMQNHGGYTDYYSDFTNEISVDGINSSALEQYLTLVSYTDSALSDLVEYFSNQEEKTIIVFFGDHQPNDTVASTILAKNGKDYQNLSTEDLQSRYKVPYIIWANYDIDEASDQETSLNYLSSELLQIAGVPTSDYQNFLLTLKEDYPIISAVRTEDLGQDTDGDMLLTYKQLQYYNLFDSEDDN